MKLNIMHLGLVAAFGLLSSAQCFALCEAQYGRNITCRSQIAALFAQRGGINAEVLSLSACAPNDRGLNMKVRAVEFVNRAAQAGQLKTLLKLDESNCQVDVVWPIVVQNQ